MLTQKNARSDTDRARRKLPRVRRFRLRHALEDREPFLAALAESGRQMREVIAERYGDAE